MRNRAETIGLMLASFPASGTQGELAAMGYLMAVEDVSDYAIGQAAKEFIKGEIDGHDKRFAPSTATFGARARLHERNVSLSPRFMIEHQQELQSEELPEAYRSEMRRRIAALSGVRRITAGDPDGDKDAA